MIPRPNNKRKETLLLTGMENSNEKEAFACYKHLFSFPTLFLTNWQPTRQKSYLYCINLTQKIFVAFFATFPYCFFLSSLMK